MLPRVSHGLFLILAAALLAPSAASAQAKEPPSCAAITFRPLTADSGDGEHDAGVYKCGSAGSS